MRFIGTQTKRTLTKWVLALVGLYLLAWTRGWFKGLFEYKLTGDFDVASLAGLALLMFAWWIHEAEV